MMVEYKYISNTHVSTCNYLVTAFQAAGPTEAANTLPAKMQIVGPLLRPLIKINLKPESN